MQIVDAQIHIWGSGLPSNMAHRQVTYFTAEEAIGLMDEGGVDAAVIHPPGWDPKSTEMAFEAVRDYPGRFAIMGALPLDEPDERARGRDWREQPGMLGLRYAFLHDPARRGLPMAHSTGFGPAAEQAGVPIAMLATDSLPEIGRIAERHPGSAADDRPPGRPRRPDDAEGRCRDGPHAGASRARQHPNIAVKATGAPGYSSGAYPYPEHAPVSAADFRCVRAGRACSGGPTSRRCRAPGGNA